MSLMPFWARVSFRPALAKSKTLCSKRPTKKGGERTVSTGVEGLCLFKHTKVPAKEGCSTGPCRGAPQLCNNCNYGAHS